MNSAPDRIGTEVSASVSADLATWIKYFNNLEAAMHEFEVGLTQQNVVPMRELEIPVGYPPEELRGRSGDLYMRITELEYRARFLREQLRAESARLPRSRTRSGPRAEWNYGSTIDINT